MQQHGRANPNLVGEAAAAMFHTHAMFHMVTACTGQELLV
jgi:hypothetical protein